MVENASKQVKEKVRTLMIATRELHGVDGPRSMWRWRGVCVSLIQIISRTVKDADGLTALQRAFHHHEKIILYLEASKKKIQITDRVFRQCLLGHSRRF